MKLTIDIHTLAPSGHHRATITTEHKTVTMPPLRNEGDALDGALTYCLHEYQRGDYSPLFGGAKAEKGSTKVFMTPNTKTIDIDAVILQSGAHASAAEGMCVMELSSYIAREPWSDHPACVDPVLGAFLRSWNDSLDDDTRQKLKPYAARVIGTATDGKSEQRAWMAVDWLARTQLPVWLDLAGLSEHAAAVRAVIAISSTETAKEAQPTLDAARAAAWAAAGGAARDAAWGAARDAAWDAAWDALRPSVVALQASAFDLLERMLSL